MAFYFSIFLATLFECRPLRAVLSLAAYRGHCNSGSVLPVVSSAINMVLDLVNFFFPIWAAWFLQMIPQNKIGIIAIFTTGLL